MKMTKVELMKVVVTGTVHINWMCGSQEQSNIIWIVQNTVRLLSHFPKQLYALILLLSRLLLFLQHHVFNAINHYIHFMNGKLFAFVLTLSEVYFNEEYSWRSEILSSLYLF